MSYSIGDVVVHKAAGNEPLVVIPSQQSISITGRVTEINPEYVRVRRYSSATQYTPSHFTEEIFHESELETPVESISREAEIFKALNAKRDEINEASTPKDSNKVVGIKHLN